MNEERKWPLIIFIILMFISVFQLVSVSYRVADGRKLFEQELLVPDFRAVFFPALAQKELQQHPAVAVAIVDVLLCVQHPVESMADNGGIQQRPSQQKPPQERVVGGFELEHLHQLQHELAQGVVAQCLQGSHGKRPQLWVGKAGVEEEQGAERVQARTALKQAVPV